MVLKKLLILCIFSMFLACSQDQMSLNPQAEDAISGSDIERSLSKKKPTKVFRTPGAITVDGNEAEWANVPKHKMRLEVNSTPAVAISNKFDLSSYFKILWDDDYLYVFANILDDEINTNGEELFERDGFEIYLDGDNSKNLGVRPPDVFPPPAYDLSDDFFRFIPGEANALSAYDIIDGSNFEFAIQTSGNGWNLEVKMPLADLIDFPAPGVAGHVFGLEFQTNDNDGDQRNNFLKWNSGLDESFFDPSLFGEAVLFDAIPE